MKSIRKRLVINFVFIVIITVSILEVLLIGMVRHNFYKNLEENMYNQLKISADLYSRYFSDASLYDNVLNNVDTFWKQSTAQVEILDTQGRVLMDSIGVMPSSPINKEDVKRALEGKKGVWIGNVEYDSKKVMAISYPLKSGEEIVGVLRYITSLRELNKDLLKVIFTFIIIGSIVVVITSILGVFLANTIVEPLKEVTTAAEKMAEGNYNVECTKRYDDEIGKLSDVLNYMAEEIVKREQLKNDFISSVSHELRTPLTSIKGWAVTLKDVNFEDMDMLQDGLDIIEKESDRLTGMVEELLDFSKFVSGKVKLKREKVDVEKLMLHIKKQLSPRAVRDDIAFKVSWEQRLPVVYSDGNRLKQVFINILDNAFNFTPAGGSVEFTADKKDGKIFFSIKDTGCGIPEDELPKIKEKFYKGKTSKSKNGIGLSICDEIIRLMGGLFEIKSQVGEGTEVYVALPIQECD